VALIWYEIVIVPVFFADATKTMNIITGVIVGVINLFMLILNFMMINSFLKNYKLKPETA
jgi:carbon starvation protein